MGQGHWRPSSDKGFCFGVFFYDSDALNELYPEEEYGELEAYRILQEELDDAVFPSLLRDSDGNRESRLLKIIIHDNSLCTYFAVLANPDYPEYLGLAEKQYELLLKRFKKHLKLTPYKPTSAWTSAKAW